MSLCMLCIIWWIAQLLLEMYDFEKCAACVQEKERMSEEELLSWMERNVVNGWSGSGSGIRCLSWTDHSYVMCEQQLPHRVV